MTVGFVEIDWRGRQVRIEHEWIAPERRDRPLLIFLHEGLGSLSMWRDFPQRLCDAAGLRGLVYSKASWEQWNADAPWYGTPKFLAWAAAALVIVLNLIYW